MESSEKIETLERELEAARGEILMLNKALNEMYHDSEGVSAIMAEETGVRMMMSVVKNEELSLVDVNTRCGMMVFPLKDRYHIVAVGMSGEGIKMLAHVQRWITSGEYAPEFFRIMHQLEEATEHGTL